MGAEPHSAARGRALGLFMFGSWTESGTGVWERRSSGNFEQELHNVRFGTALIGHQYCHLNLGSVHKCAINGKIPCDTGVKHAAH